MGEVDVMFDTETIATVDGEYPFTTSNLVLLGNTGQFGIYDGAVTLSHNPLNSPPGVTLHHPLMELRVKKDNTGFLVFATLPRYPVC